MQLTTERLREFHHSDTLRPGVNINAIQAGTKLYTYLSQNHITRLISLQYYMFLFLLLFLLSCFGILFGFFWGFFFMSFN